MKCENVIRIIQILVVDYDLYLATKIQTKIIHGKALEDTARLVLCLSLDQLVLLLDPCWKELSRNIGSILTEEYLRRRSEKMKVIAEVC